MRVGLFTDTYFPQVSGVATSIKTLKIELEKAGHEVYIFTTTDKHVERYADPKIIRLPSVPFPFFTDRQIAYSGFSTAYKQAKDLKLDIIHTHTEFSMGLLGKDIARELGVPLVHTYHTQYEDYVHYIAKGRLIRPSMVKYLIRVYMHDLDGVICPSEIVLDILNRYKVSATKRVIPTGIILDGFVDNSLTEKDVEQLRQSLGFAPDEKMLLSVSRISYEKNIQTIIRAMPEIIEQNDKIKLVIAGGGPYQKDLEELVASYGLEGAVIFTGMVEPSQIKLYYKAADFFISASVSETQGLTYLESLASGTPIIAHGNPYLNTLVDDKMFGTLFYSARDLADAVIDAFSFTPEMTEAGLAAKRFEISSENFGRRVCEFYMDLQINKRYRNVRPLGTRVTLINGESDRIIETLRKTPRGITQLSKITVRSAGKVLQAPIRTVNIIRRRSERESDE